MKFPQELAPQGAVSDKEKIVGRVPHTGVPAGVPILDNMLLPPGVKAGIHVPPGFRAVAVKIDEGSGVDNHMQPGCRVDVVGYFTIKQSGKTETVARTIIENVEVAAVGQRLSPDAPSKSEGKDGKSSSSGKPEKPARAATLLVKPEQVPTLLLAEQKGEIKLSMRGLEDTSLAGRDDKTHEKDVTGEGDAEQKAAAEQKKQTDLLANFMDGFKKKEKAEAKLEETAAPAVTQNEEPAEPQFESTMVLYLGSEKKVLGWVAGYPNQPIDITGTAEANIFEPQPQFPPRPTRGIPDRMRTPTSSKTPTTPATPSNPNQEDNPEPKPELTPEPEQEAKELIG
jgi:Flp pilus assembly protein CpaB